MLPRHHDVDVGLDGALELTHGLDGDFQAVLAETW
jgi:hypothetical protein